MDENALPKLTQLFAALIVAVAIFLIAKNAAAVL